MKLISATPSPFARKVRIVAIEKGIDLEIIDDIPWRSDTIVVGLNPLEQLPILITDADVPIYNSGFIVDWLERTMPEPALIPADDGGFLRCKTLEIIANGVLDAALLYTREIGRSHIDEEWRDRQSRKIVNGVAAVATSIGTRAFAVGDRFTVADAAVGTMLAALEFGEGTGLSTPAGTWRAQHGALGDYLDRLSERRSFTETRPVMFDFEFSPADQS